MLRYFNITRKYRWAFSAIFYHMNLDTSKVIPFYVRSIFDAIQQPTFFPPSILSSIDESSLRGQTAFKLKSRVRISANRSAGYLLVHYNVPGADGPNIALSLQSLIQLHLQGYNSFQPIYCSFLSQNQ